jgi:hypothetical protein
MRRALILALLLTASLGFGQALIYTADATLSWDAVTTLNDGTAIDAADTVEYEVGRSPDPVADRANPAMIIGTSTTTSLAITLPDDGTWYVYAVRAKLTTDGGQTTLYSPWNWSDQNGLATPDPFWYRHPSTVPPSVPLGFAGQ